MKNKPTFFERNKDTLISVLQSLLLYALKSQALGGFKGWLIKTVVKEFAEEVIEVVQVLNDKYVIKKKVNSTVNNEDRNEATDNLNDIFTS